MPPSSGYNEGVLSCLQELVTRSNSRDLSVIDLLHGAESLKSCL